MSICPGILHSDGVFSKDEVCLKKTRQADANRRHFEAETYLRERVSSRNIGQTELTAYRYSPMLTRNCQLLWLC